MRQDPTKEVDLDFRFEGELALLRIDIDGPEFHRSITGELSRGLAAYQDEIYKAAKVALYGREGRIQLSPEQRTSFELVFEVNDGSTELLAAVQSIAEGLAQGLTTMEPHLLAIVVVSVVLILVTGYVATKVHAAIQETKREKNQQDQNVTLAQTVAREQEALAAVLTAKGSTQVTQRFEQAQSEGIKQILRSVPSAVSVDVGGVEFDSDDRKELRRRSPRAKSEYIEVTGSFRIFADTNISPIRLTLSGRELPGEFNADWPVEMETEKEDQLWKAIRTKSVLALEIGATIIRDQVRSAVILDVLDDPMRGLD